MHNRNPIYVFLTRCCAFIIRSYKKQMFASGIKKIDCENFLYEISGELTLIDIGASYFLPDSWRLPLKNTKTHLICIEPNAYNLEYLNALDLKPKVTKIPHALSGTGGTRTLYKTNVDSGSSLFPPRAFKPLEEKLNPSLNAYFFPIEKTEIQTLTLSEILESAKITSPILIKLDIQGAELEVLQSIENILRSGDVVGIETEASLLSQPLMTGSSKFSEINLFLAKCGFDLLNLKPIFSPNGSNSKKGYLNECDSFYVLSYDDSNSLSIEQKMALFITYISFGFANHAQALVDVDITLQNVIYKNITPSKLESLLNLIAKYGLSYLK